VNEAKRQVFGQVGIESLAGPSEILVFADESGNPDYIAADLLSQAEHDEQARAILVSTDDTLIEETARALAEQLAQLPRREIAEKSMAEQGGLIKVDDLSEGIELVNYIAPEHLELQLQDAEAALEEIYSAGAVFMGHFTPEPVGDYWAGSNHILPTAGAARYASALSARDFVRFTSVIEFDKGTLAKEGNAVARFARLEGLEAHARSVDIRTKG
jgi:histidinol dehydrogenase